MTPRAAITVLAAIVLALAVAFGAYAWGTDQRIEDLERCMWGASSMSAELQPDGTVTETPAHTTGCTP